MRRCLTGLAALGLLLAPAGEGWASVLSPRVQRIERAFAPGLSSAASGDAALLAPYLRSAIENFSAPGAASAPGKEPRVRLLITIDNAQALRDAGFSVRTEAGNMATAAIPVTRLGELEDVPGLRYVELSLPVELKLDVSTNFIHSNSVNGGEQPPYSGYTGDGVLVGFVDSGVDFHHEDFRNEDGTSRIVALWDQNVNGQHAPEGYDYGTEWLKSQIEAGTPTQVDEIGHGTHVSGIAGGNGRAADEAQDKYRYVGVAPECSLAMVSTIFDEDSLVDGIAWIQALATSMGMPCVVNMSLGNQFGAHDGTAGLDRALANLSGAGRILVAAAGNEQQEPIHAERVLAPSETVTFPMNIGAYTPYPGSGNEIVSLEAWYDGSGDLEFTVTTPGGTKVGPVNSSVGTKSVGTVDGKVDMTHGTYAFNQDKRLILDIWDSSAPVKAGTWSIQVRNRSASASTELDFWIAGTALGQVSPQVQWSAFVDYSELVNSPASSPGVIGVGAYVTKTTWASADGSSYRYGNSPPPVGSLAPFSSPGPQRNGDIKPDFCAPGMGVASAKSLMVPSSPLTSFNDIRNTTPDTYHIMITGTSMATPHVAGTVALLLERDPNLTLDEVKTHLRANLTPDSFTGNLPNPYFGYGKIDAQKAMNSLVPVVLLHMSAAWEDGRAVLRWSLVETEPGSRFRIERGPTARGPFTEAAVVTSSELDLSWVDPAPDPDRPWYRVSVTARDGTVNRFGPVRLDPRTGPARLLQNAPNPFSEDTRIAFEISTPQFVSLDIIDPNGRLVARLARETFPAGRHEASWDGRDDAGRPAAAGVYFARLATDGTVQVRRLNLVR